MNAKTLRKAVNAYNRFAPNSKSDIDAELKSNYFTDNLPTVDVHKRHAKYAPTEIDFDDHVPTMSAIRSKLLLLFVHALIFPKI